MFNCEMAVDTGSPGWNYRDLTHSHRRAHDMALASVGVSDVGQPTLLIMLLRRKERGIQTTQKELATLMRISPPTLTVSVKNLEKHGYVHKITDENDKRRNYIAITDKGEKAAKDCIRCLDEVDSVMYNGFSDEERLLVAEYLSRMTKNLKDYVQTSSGGMKTGL